MKKVYTELVREIQEDLQDAEAMNLDDFLEWAGNSYFEAYQGEDEEGSEEYDNFVSYIYSELKFKFHFRVKDIEDHNLYEYFETLEEAEKYHIEYSQFQCRNEYNNDWDKFQDDPNSGYIIEGYTGGANGEWEVLR